MSVGVSSGRQYVDMVAQERREARYAADMERWRNSLRVQSAAAAAALEGVLTFGGEGWMTEIDLKEEKEREPTTRQREIDYLRRYFFITLTKNALLASRKRSNV